MSVQRLILPLFLTLAAGGCTVASGGNTPTRSPSLDYALPPAQTADGQILGVDGVPPENRLRESPRLGSGIATPAGPPKKPPPAPPPNLFPNARF